MRVIIDTDFRVTSQQGLPVIPTSSRKLSEIPRVLQMSEAGKNKAIYGALSFNYNHSPAFKVNYALQSNHF